MANITVAFTSLAHLADRLGEEGRLHVLFPSSFPVLSMFASVLWCRYLLGELTVLILPAVADLITSKRPFGHVGCKYMHYTYTCKHSNVRTCIDIICGSCFKLKTRKASILKFCESLFQLLIGVQRNALIDSLYSPCKH